MDKEMVEAIGVMLKDAAPALLILLGIPAVVLILYVFREEVKQALPNLRLRWKRKDTEIEARTTPPADLVDTSAALETEVQDSSEGLAKAPHPEEGGEDKGEQRQGPQSADHWILEMQMDFYTRNIESGEEAYRKAQDAEANTGEKARNEALYLSLRFRFADDKSALDRLMELAASENPPHNAQFLVGACYREAGNHEAAVRAFDQAALDADTEKSTAKALVAAAKSKWEIDQKEKAIEDLTNAIGTFTDSAARVDTYKGVADLHGKRNEYLAQALILEKILEITPNDVDIRFASAFAYYRAGQSEVSRLHYTKCLSFRPDYDLAINNLGVCCDKIGLESLAIGHYEKAANAGNTLAMSNLAKTLISADLLDQAQGWLDKARRAEDVHENVAGTMVDLRAKRRSQKELSEKVDAEAARRHRFFMKYVDGFLDSDTNHPEPFGTWASLSANLHADEFAAWNLFPTWPTPAVCYRILAPLSNKRRAQECVCTKQTGAADPVTHGQAYLIVSPDRAEVNVMIVDESDNSAEYFEGLTQQEIKPPSLPQG